MEDETVSGRLEHSPAPWYVSKLPLMKRMVLAKSGDCVAEVVPLMDETPGNLALVVAAPELADALFYLGGGDEYIVAYGRLCFCPLHGKPDKHATVCDRAWDAYLKAVTGRKA